VLSLYLVALGVSYPIGSLVQGPLADSLGLAWTTAGAGALLAIALVVMRVLRPGVFQTLAAPVSTEAPPSTASC
jgi:predicted MFS family arabinose efflux permease